MTPTQLAVSIRARPDGRAMPAARVFGHGSPEFQSAPGLMAGRCFTAASRFARAAAFQSAPGLMAGRCLATAIQSDK